MSRSKSSDSGKFCNWTLSTGEGKDAGGGEGWIVGGGSIHACDGGVVGG